MTDNINFLRQQFDANQRKKRAIFIFELSTFLLLIIYGIGIVVLFTYLLILNKESQAVKQNVDIQVQNIKSLEPVEMQQTYLKNKTNSLAELFSDQLAHQRLVEAVFNLLPQGISVKGFSIDEKGGVRFSAQTGDFTTLKNFLTNLETTTKIGDLKLSKIIIQSLSYTLDKGYLFNIYILFEG